jgi:pilus assembly protein Flp/PilA
MIFMFVQNLLTRLRRDERGATAVEYGLIVALIAVAIIAALTKIGHGLTVIFNKAASAL